jgi:cardiolipin synthase
VGSRDWIWEKFEIDLNLKIHICVFNPVPWPIGRFLVRKTLIRHRFFEFWSKINRRNHKKVVIIDEKKLFLGSMNVHAAAFDWVEVGIKDESELASIMSRFFFFFQRRSYVLFRGSSGSEAVAIHSGTLLAPDTLLLQHTRNQRKKFRNSHRHYFNLAKKEIFLVTPYFIPSIWLIGSLGKAVKRGVVVRLLLSKKLDYKFLNWVIDGYLFSLVDMGVEVYKSSPMVHAKLVVADDWVHLGSSNLNQRSSHLDMEANIVVTDEVAKREILDDVKRLIANSERVTIETLNQRPWQEKVLGFLLQIFKTYL